MSDKQPSPVALWVAAGLVGLLLVGVVVMSQVLGGEGDGTGTGRANDGADDATTATTGPARTGPVPLVPVDAPSAGSAECAALTAALPEELPDTGDPLRRLPIADPAPPATAAWGTDRGEPVVLRCGLSRPAELNPVSDLTVIDGVQWLTVVDPAGARTSYVVDRPVYAAVTLPPETGTGSLQQLSATIAATLAATPVEVR